MYGKGLEFIRHRAGDTLQGPPEEIKGRKGNAAPDIG